jgi:GNAT superfamily N-acetyltransferase
MQIARATVSDAQQAEAILREVSQWLIALGRKLWDQSEIFGEDIARVAERGELVIGRENGEAIACMYLQKADPLFWPKAKGDEALYVHRLAVRRRFAGQALAQQMLDWAALEAIRLGRTHVRLDTEMRPALLHLYERAGFVRVDREPIVVGGHSVVRLERRVSETMRARNA